MSKPVFTINGRFHCADCGTETPEIPISFGFDYFGSNRYNPKLCPILPELDEFPKGWKLDRKGKFYCNTCNEDCLDCNGEGEIDYGYHKAEWGKCHECDGTGKKRC